MSHTDSSHPRLLPPLPEAVLSDEEAAHIIERYGLGDLRAREDLTLGTINWNCAVETSQGRFFLKRRHPALSAPALIEAQHQLIAHLRANGIPAPEVHRTPGGDSFVAHGGHLYEVHAWASGQRYDGGQPGHLEAAGAMLARYHLAARTFEPPEPLLRRRGWLYGPAIMERLARYLEGRWSGLDDWWAEMRERAATIGEAHPQHADLTSLVIHGDYYANNLLFEGDHIVALLDYDNAAHQSRVVEVAEALIYFANQRDERLSVGVYDGIMNLERVGRFMAAYDGVWALTPGERAALPATVQAIWLTVSLRRLDERADASRGEALARLREAKLLSDWVEAHSAALVEAASSA